MTSSVSILFLHWYFIGAPKGILGAWRNFLIWAANTFSLGLTLRTLFSPWRRAVMVYRSKGLDIGYWLEVIVYTNLSRFVGFWVRLFTILIAIIWLVIVFLFGLILFVGWFFLPILVIFFIFAAFS